MDRLTECCTFGSPFVGISPNYCSWEPLWGGRGASTIVDVPGGWGTKPAAGRCAMRSDPLQILHQP